ncbi:IS110 family transposase, partial [Streptococcus pyogenes]
STHPTTVAFESCGGAHWLARKCEALGHQAKLIPPQYVKPYVKTNKNDFVDAEAIAEASTRPSMRFVCPKTEEQQVMAICHRVRSGYVAERT